MDWLKQQWQILGIFHSILHHILYYARVIVTKMQSRVNLLVDSLHNITSWGKIKDINKYYFGCAHTKAQQTVPEQTSPTVSNSHNTFKCQ